MSYLSDTLGDAYKEGMTEEEISSALESITTKKFETLKNQLSKANGEAAEYKRQLRAKQTEDEQKAAEDKEFRDRIVAENEELKRNARLSELKASVFDFCGNEESAKSFATAIMENDGDSIVSQVRDLLKSNKAAWESDALRNTGRPDKGGNVEVTADYDKQIAVAQSTGDMAQVAYLMRLKQQQNS